MKFKKKRSGYNNASGFCSVVKGRKEQRKQNRLQKKQNRALYAARLQGKHHQRQSNSGGEKVESRSGKIKQLQAFVDAEKMKMKSKFPNNQLPLKTKKNLTAPESPIQSEETGGFKASVSNSDRLARLQEFVNREAGISQGKNSKADRADKDSESIDSNNKGNLIKDKKKLNMLRKEQKEDTREINKLARLLGYRKPHQKKKVAPIFDDDFGSLLEDIDAGTMVHGDSYKSDDRNAQDSEDDFEKDMAIALGQELKKKGNLGKDAGMNGNLENNGDSENGNEQFMKSDFDDFESGMKSEDDEVSIVDVDEYEGEEDDEIDEEGSIGCDEEMSESDEQGSSSFFKKKKQSSDSAVSDPKYDRSRNEQDEEEEEEEDHQEDEEEEEEDSFLDSQAEEDSMEESDDDRELVHDIRKEVDYAFEGGSRYYSKPEILKNGQENDIDRYSSCSEDDEDLEDFIVDDSHVEYEDVSDELPDEHSDSSSPVKKKKKRIIVPSDNSEDDGQIENKNDDDDGIVLIPRRKNEERKRKELSDSSSPVKKKKKKRVITSDNSEDDRYINNGKDNVDDTYLIPRMEKEKRKRKNDFPKKIAANISCDEGDCEDSDGAPHIDSEAEKTRKQEKETCNIKITKKKNTKSSDKEDIESKKSVLKLKSNLPKKIAVVQISSSEDEEACSIKKTKKFNQKYSDVEDKENKKSRLKGKNNVPKKKAVVHVFASKDDSEDSDNEHHIDDKGDSKRKREREACNKEKKQKTQSCNLKDVKKQISILKSEDKASPQKKMARVSFDLPNPNDSDCDELSDEEEENDELESEALSVEEEEEEMECVADGNELKEDIYGRLKDMDGNIVNPSTREAGGTGRYVPPALRKLMALNTDERKKEQLANLKKSLKGLLNRLAESNMGGIVSQIEGMYLKHSRNDMNDIITNLLMESLVVPTLTPERLVQEHALVVAVLSANVGNEVGAHILNEFVLRWSDTMDSLPVGEEVETKELDNLLLFTANLYNFRVVEAQLIYDILNRLAQGFSSKEVELILLILRSVGFTLRKENPLALKSLITKIQSQAAVAQSSDEEAEFSRVRFMLEVVQAIRNNNMAKVPNFDPAHSEHLKKIQKGLIRKGTQTSQLNVTLEDLLKSRECGRWWIVGSAWAGTLPGERPPQENRYQNPTKNKALETEFSEKFKAKAAKLQLSRPPRINILYIITEGSEDYLDAFEKLLQLSLPATQERDLFSVVLLCCQKSKVYNPFFAHLADRMCKFDKKYKRLLQFALWDKFQEIENIKPREVANLARFLSHLIGENSLSLFILKHISFMEAESQMISFLRQVLIRLLLHPAGSDTVHRVFSELSVSPKLDVLRQSLRIFILKFLSTKKNKEISEHQMLSKRIEEVTDILNKGRGISL